MFVIPNLLVLILFGISVVFSKEEEVPEHNTTSNIDDDYQEDIQEVNHVLAKYMVSLRMRGVTKMLDDNHRCAGSIISPEIVVTAAHCIYHPTEDTKLKATDLHVVIGSPNRFDNETSITIDVAKYTVHESFDVYDFKNDIVKLYLREKIVENNATAQRIPLTSESPKVGTSCTVAGWGRILNQGPLAVEVNYDEVSIIHQKLCLQKFSLKYAYTIICASNKNDIASEKGVCFGDFGGPLICNGELAGIASISSNNGCSVTGFPDGFTNIWNYRNWIQNNARRWEVNIGLIIWSGLSMINLYFYHLYMNIVLG